MILNYTGLFEKNMAPTSQKGGIKSALYIIVESGALSHHDASTPLIQHCCQGNPTNVIVFTYFKEFIKKLWLERNIFSIEVLLWLETLEKSQSPGIGMFRLYDGINRLPLHTLELISQTKNEIHFNSKGYLVSFKE